MEKINDRTLAQFREAFSKALAEKHGFATTDLNVLHDGMNYTFLAWSRGESPVKAAEEFAANMASLFI